jgi:YHS domain-containing protein
MKNNLLLIALTVLISLMACKDKNAKPSDNQDIPGQVRRPGSNNPQSVAGRLDQATAAAADQTWAGDVDLVCNMKIDRSVEDTVHHQNKVYGFCSESCKETFQKDPAKFVTK